MSAVVIIGIIVIVAILIGGGLAYYFTTKNKTAPAPGPAPVPAGKCTMATQSSKCVAPTPFCKLQSGAEFGDCVGCTSNNQCSSGQVCLANQCVTSSQSGCTDSSNCSTNDKHKLCYLPSGNVSGNCVECLSNTDCASKTATPVCGPAKTCIATPASTCSNDASCISVSGKSKCLKSSGASSGVCVQCLQSSDCASGMTCTANVCVAPPASSGPIWYLRGNKGCSNGKNMAHLRSDLGPFSPFVSDQYYGATACFETPENDDVYFYNGNDVACPNGATKVGWVRQTSIDYTGAPSPNIYGLTVCRAPKGFSVPNDFNVKIIANQAPCPTGYGIVGWIKDNLFDKDGTNASDQPYGLTICRKN